MKRKAAFSILVMFLAISVLPCFAAAPPTEPPTEPPRTKLPRLIGTWQGTVWVAQESGYSSYEMTLKITDQRYDYMFRGYMTAPGGGSEVFVAGVMNDSNNILMVTPNGTWSVDMWWGDAPGMGVAMTDPHGPSVIAGTLMKTTK